MPIQFSQRSEQLAEVSKSLVLEHILRILILGDLNKVIRQHKQWLFGINYLEVMWKKLRMCTNMIMTKTQDNSNTLDPLGILINRIWYEAR